MTGKAGGNFRLSRSVRDSGTAITGNLSGMDAGKKHVVYLSATKPVSASVRQRLTDGMVLASQIVLVLGDGTSLGNVGFAETLTRLAREPHHDALGRQCAARGGRRVEVAHRRHLAFLAILLERLSVGGKPELNRS